jgi:outer membrane protein assembly factor BamB
MKSLLHVFSIVALVGLVGCADKPKSDTTPPRKIAEPAESQASGAAKSEAAPVPKTDVPKTDVPKTGATKSDAAFWPQFHGPKNDNISTDKGLLKQWPEAGPKLIWTAKELGDGWSSVSIVAGRMFTAGNVDEKTVVFALDVNDGKLLWKKEIGGAWTVSNMYPGSHGTPTIEGDRLYFESAVGDVVCMNVADGAIVWSKNILKDFDAPNTTWAIAESILIDGDRLICCPGGPKASVAALDKKTGGVVWAAKSTGDKAGYATPAIAESQGLKMILTMNEKALIGVAADNGELLFRHEHQTKYDINATTPVLLGDQIFITSGYGSGAEMLKLKVDGKKASVQRLWENKKLDNHHGGVVVLDGHIYGSAHGGAWVCVEWATGKQTHSDRGVGKGSFTYADGMFYTLSENGGKVGLVEATPAAHKVTSQFKIPEGGKGNSWAHPVVAGGRLYIRHGEFLYAYDVRQ